MYIYTYTSKYVVRAFHIDPSPSQDSQLTMGPAWSRGSQPVSLRGSPMGHDWRIWYPHDDWKPPHLRSI